MPSFFDAMAKTHDRIPYVKEAVREMKNHLQVGQRVKPDPNHESYQGWFNQYKHSHGRVLTYEHGGTTEGWVNVGWDNGNSEYCYPEEMLIPINEEGEEEIVGLPEHLQVGQRVKPNPLHNDYEKFIQQHRDNAGTIISDTSSHEYNVVVTWDNNHRNSYNSDMLIPILSDEETVQFDSKQIQIKEKLHESGRVEEPRNYDLPILPGERFCLNPESSDYGYLARDYDLTGYVRTIDSIDSMVEWKSWSMSRRKGINIDVQFDNGKTIVLNQKHILPIESQAKTVTKYFIARKGQRSYSAVYAVIEGDIKSKTVVDKQIIISECYIDKIEVYDNDWRANMIEKIINYEE